MFKSSLTIAIPLYNEEASIKHLKSRLELLLAKSNSKIFFISELVANVYTLLFNIIGYYYYGLEGLGISFLVSYMLSLIQVFLIAKIKYDFSIGKNLMKIFIGQFSISILGFLCTYFMIRSNAFIVGILIILISCSYSLKELDNRVNVKQYFSKNEKR